MNKKELTDADKLLAVCRVVWPEESMRHDARWEAGWSRGNWEVFYGGLVRVLRTHADGTNWWADDDNEGEENECFDPTSIDDLRRVLLALTPGQHASFGFFLAERLGHHESEYDQWVVMEPSKVLMAEPTQILDALYRALCNQNHT